MKKLTIIYIIFAFVLTASTGCTKFRETTRDFQKPPQYSDSSDAAPIVNNKESWSEWTSRQWNENRTRWIGSIVGTALVATGLYFSYKWLKNRNAEQPPQPAVPENSIPNDAEAQPTDNGVAEQDHQDPEQQIDNGVAEQDHQEPEQQVDNGIAEQDHQDPEQQIDANPFINQQATIVHETQEEVSTEEIQVENPPHVEKKIYRYEYRADGAKTWSGKPLYQPTNEPNPNAFYESDDEYDMVWGDDDDSYRDCYELGKKRAIPQAVLDRVRVKKPQFNEEEEIG
jgi:hypothetical protein